jgi:hypothetical protein
VVVVVVCAQDAIANPRRITASEKPSIFFMVPLQKDL